MSLPATRRGAGGAAPERGSPDSLRRAGVLLPERQRVALRVQEDDEVAHRRHGRLRHDHGAAEGLELLRVLVRGLDAYVDGDAGAGSRVKWSVYPGPVAGIANGPDLDRRVIEHVVDDLESAAVVQRNDGWRRGKGKFGALIPKRIEGYDIQKAANLLSVGAFLRNRSNKAQPSFDFRPRLALIPRFRLLCLLHVPHEVLIAQRGLDYPRRSLLKYEGCLNRFGLTSHYGPP